VRIWDARTLRPLRVLDHPDGVEAVAFAPSSRTIATLDLDGRLRFFSACDGCGDARLLLDEAAARVTRELSPAERRIFLGE
jgi:WD40 repeat protein